MFADRPQRYRIDLGQMTTMRLCGCAIACRDVVLDGVVGITLHARTSL